MKEYLYRLATDEAKGWLTLLPKAVLFILSLLYAAALKISAALYRLKLLKQYKLNAKVISVGNITWGGTGKTPLVVFLAQTLSKDHKPAVLIRGYGSDLSRTSVWAKFGDEAFMLSETVNVPVLAREDRLISARQAINDFSCDTLILDDGFQQWRIGKDLEIVVIDAAAPFGNGRLIPRGILREPLSVLKRAEIFFLTRTDLASNLPQLRERLAALNPEALIVESVHQPVGFYDLKKKDYRIDELELASLKNVAILCAIGNPRAFEKTVSALGINVKLRFFFLDHHCYSTSEMDNIIETCRKEDIPVVITTQKDAVKLRDYVLSTDCGVRVLVLKTEIFITKARNEFLSRLSGLYTA
ncbi:MAG: tetraacyldisaccharide 4'-kinase [Candidatus Omnitrophota bacterium]